MCTPVIPRSAPDSESHPVIPRSAPDSESHAQLPPCYLPLTTEPPIQSVPGALDLGVEWAGDEAENSPLSSTEGKNKWSCTSSSLYVFMAYTGTTFFTISV
jgi:hypothetical protein